MTLYSEDLGIVLKNIDNILRTRIQGVNWFHFFRINDGAPCENLGRVPIDFPKEEITNIGAELITLSTLLVKKFPLLHDVVEELVLVGTKRRLFFLPYGDLCLAIETNEKIGDVCFHSLWCEESSPVGIKHYLKPNNWDNVCKPTNVLNCGFSKTSKHIDIAEDLIDWFERKPYCVTVIDHNSKNFTPHLFDSDEYIADLLAGIKERSSYLKDLLSEMRKPIGDIVEILIGQEALRLSTRKGGSVIISTCSEDRSIEAMVVTGASLGSTLYSMRIWNNPNRVRLHKYPKLSSIYDEARDDCLECTSNIRLPIISQLTYDLEKLDLETYDSDSDVNPLETPDVTGALLSAGKEVVKNISDWFGNLSRIDIALGHEDLNSSDINLSAGKVSDDLAFLLITKETGLYFKTRIQDSIFRLQKCFKKMCDITSYSEETTSSSCLFTTNDENAQNKLFLTHSKLSLKCTPLKIHNIKHLTVPTSELEKKVVINDNFIADLFQLVDRAKIFLQFILKEEDRPWVLSIIGDEGCVSAFIKKENNDIYHCIIGGATDKNVFRVEEWVHNSLTVAISPNQTPGSDYSPSKTEVNTESNKPEPMRPKIMFQQIDIKTGN